MEEKYYELTAPQKAIWLTEQYYKNTNINNVCGTFFSKEKLNFTLLKKSINIFLQNNDSFKIKLHLVDGEIKQYFSKMENIDFKVIKIKSEKEQRNLAEQTASEVFNLLDSLLFKIVLFKYPDNHGGFVINSHHIISDSWTNGLIANDIALIYDKLKNNESYSKDENLSYKNYLKSEEDYINSPKFEKDKEYWNKVFNTIPEVATIPSIKETSNNQDSLDAKRLLLSLDDKILDKINNYCEENKVSLYNFFMTIFAIYLGRVSNLNEFVIGTPILNRTNFKEKQTTGMFINTLPLKINLKNNETVLENLKDIAINSMGLLRHQKYSFQYILENLRKMDSSLPKLYNILFSYQITKMNVNEEKLSHTTSWTFNRTIDDDLDIHMLKKKKNGSIKIAYDYKTTKYNKQDILNTHTRIMYIINQVIKDNKILLKDIEIVTPEEKLELFSFNNVTVDFNEDLDLITMFKQQVKKSPEKIAISFEGNEISYKDLDIKSDMVAYYLTKNKVNISDTVSILLPRSLELFISIIGILKTGAKYMCIDDEFPDTRKKYMIEDSKSKFCITNDIFYTFSKKITTAVNIFDIIKNTTLKEYSYSINPNNGCYVIYTSGSTGQPKGIVVSHKNVVNYVHAFQKEYNINSSDTILQQFTPSFDAFVEEFYPALLIGAKIFAVSKQTICNIKKLESFINNENISLISCSPLLLNQINKLPPLHSVKIFISGGDVLKKDFYSNLIKYADVYNTYGPTETTVCSTYHKCTGNEKDIIPIGESIANCHNYIMSSNGTLLPKGYIGELYIGGKGVSLGYLGNPSLNEQKFIHWNNEIVYKTGDLCRYNSNGEIEFIGRIDNQLKLRGYRINLNEIEKMLKQYPGISDSIVLDFTDDNNIKKLCAYYISNITFSSKELREYLGRVLPNYMVPAVFIKISTIPITINGKLDKHKLPDAFVYYKRKNITEYIAPVTKTEKDLEKIWKDILSLDKISVIDNIFELGADSISVISFQAIAYKEKWNITSQNIYQYPTIKKMASIIDSKINNVFSLPEQEYYKQIYSEKLLNKPRKNNPHNIFLTGVPGFLGIHILNYILENTDCKVICLVRGKNDSFSKKRVYEMYEFYFNKKLSKYDNRIKIISGDITKDKFTLSEKKYQNLISMIDVFIHSAAIVKHHGNNNVFNEINVNGTKNVVDFCIASNCELHHISTISVSGQVSTSPYKFTEKDFFINQNYKDNIYIESKFNAEAIVLKSIKENGLYAKIYRVGNLVSRYSDGVFQKNINENHFYSQLKTIIKSKKIPKEMLPITIDFSPVDYTSKAIGTLIFNNPSSEIIYHVYNNNKITIKELVTLLNALNMNINTIKNEIYTSSTSNTNDLSSLLLDLSLINSNITVDNQFTCDKLKSLNFEWPNIDIVYIKKIIQYIKQKNFI